FRLLILFVEVRELVERDAFDVAADAAFGKRKRHPRLETLEDARLHFRMRLKKIIEPIGPRVHQMLEPIGARGVFRTHVFGRDEEAHTQVAPDLLLTVGLRKAPLRQQIVLFDAIEVVFRLRVDETEYRIRVALAVYMRNAPIVAHDRDALRLRVEPSELVR